VDMTRYIRFAGVGEVVSEVANMYLNSQCLNGTEQTVIIVT
jgi:hypothetical protein